MARVTTPKVTPQQSAEAEGGKQQALATAIAAIEKEYGKGSIMTMANAKPLSVDSIPTGSLSLDLALGVGGVPRGRIVEIFGPESTGKTTLAMSIVAQAQKIGGLAAFIDAEHAFDPEYGKSIGIDMNSLLISQPDNGEQALEICETLVRSNAVDIIVVDSVAALVPRSEIEGDMGDAQVGAQARLMSQALRKLTGITSKSRTCVIFINQLRMKIGVMFGNPETTTGGMALKFYSSVRMDIRRVESLKEGDNVVGNRVRVKIVKNKVAAPFRTAEFDLIFPRGISREGDLLDLGVKYNLIEKSGSWFVARLDGTEEKLGQGRDAARKFIAQNPAMMDRLEKLIKEAALAAAPGATVPAPPPVETLVAEDKGEE